MQEQRRTEKRNLQQWEATNQLEEMVKSGSLDAVVKYPFYILPSWRRSKKEQLAQGALQRQAYICSTLAGSLRTGVAVSLRYI